MLYERPGTWPNPVYYTPALRRKTWATPHMEEYSVRRVSDAYLLAIFMDYTLPPWQAYMAGELLALRTAAGVAT